MTAVIGVNVVPRNVQVYVAIVQSGGRVQARHVLLRGPVDAGEVAARQQVVPRDQQRRDLAAGTMREARVHCAS